MGIDITIEKLISPKDYAAMRPAGRNGRPMNIATAYRHMFDGIQGVYLEHVKIGGNTYTSVEAVQRFVERLTADRASEMPRSAEAAPAAPLATRTAAARKRAFAEAERELDAQKV